MTLLWCSTDNPAEDQLREIQEDVRTCHQLDSPEGVGTGNLRVQLEDTANNPKSPV